MTRSDLAAGIDLGTNTALLLVARLDADGRLEVVEDECRTPRLGEGVARAGTLAPGAIERALAALRDFRARIDALGVPRSRTRAVGTAVLRRAADARAFVERVRAETGLEVEIVSGAEEARLGRIAARAEGLGPETIVIDVGGGSSEVACEDLGLAVSAPIGAVTLSETCTDSALAGGSGLAAGGGLAAMIASARSAALVVPEGIARPPLCRPVVALGGTALNLACLTGERTAFDHVWAEGRCLPAGEAWRQADRLAVLDPAARRALPIEASRAGILPAGLVCLGAILERLGAEFVRVSGRGLRYGIVRLLFAEEPASTGPAAVPRNLDSRAGRPG